MNAPASSSHAAAAADSVTIFRGDFEGLRNVVPISERMTPAFFKREQEHIFRRAWLPVASAADVAEPGSYLTVEVPPLKASLLIARGSDNVVRVFHNVCRHRGEKLVHAPQGSGTRAFICGFHGWTFANTGKLAVVTDEGQFRNLDKEQYNLIPVHSEVWEDLIFVNLDSNPRESLKEWLGDLYDQYRGFAKDRVKTGDHRVVLKTNWNLAVNAFSEGYHNLYIHKHTVPDYQGGKGNPKRHRAYIEVGRHFGRYSALANPNHKPTPAEDVLYRHSRKMFPAFPSFDMDSLPPGVNPSRSPLWAFDIVHLFPCFVLGPQANTHSYMWFWPIDHEHTEIRIMRFGFRSDRPADRIAQAHSVIRGREVLREDLATMESSLQAIASGVLPHIILSQQELLIQNHYRNADDMLEQP